MDDFVDLAHMQKHGWAHHTEPGERVWCEECCERNSKELEGGREGTTYMEGWSVRRRFAVVADRQLV